MVRAVKIRKSTLQSRALWRAHLVMLAVGLAGLAHPRLAVGAAALVNPGFEEPAADGSPLGWTVLQGLDAHGYGPPTFKQRFDEIRPTIGEGGYHSGRCLSFPAKGTWSCPVFTQSNGDGRQKDGRQLAKAAVYQTIELPGGRYRFSVWLRTAEGDLYSAAFSLGVNLGPAASFANDASSGIQWTGHHLAMSRSLLRGVAERGEWCRYETEPFELKATGQVTVWIRFNYVNENQMRVRWQADDAAIVPVAVEAGPKTSGPIQTPCQPIEPPIRHRALAGDAEGHLIDAAGTELIDARHYRLFRRARRIPAGAAARYRFPRTAPGEPVSLLVAAAGGVKVEVDGAVFTVAGDDSKWPITHEWVLPGTPSNKTELEVTVRSAGPSEATLYEIEVGWPGRTAARLMHVEADVVAVPWVVGSWDASSGEYVGQVRVVGDVARAQPEQLAPAGRWELHFQHAPVPGRRYYIIHGLLAGQGTIDIGADGIVDWVAQTKGEEIVDFDATELLKPGPNTVVLEASGGHDFAALVETCPSTATAGHLRLAFEGDELADLHTQVIDNTWFWLRELHYEPSGFIDASVPKGKWYSQYWPVDMGFALREWVRWGYHEESVRTAVLISGSGWHGHDTNLSGGSDNTGGNIVVLQLCEVLRRGDDQIPPDQARVMWERIRGHCQEVVTSAAESPFGLIRGTNWENAGNREHGPCYALSTTLGAAATLRKAVELAEQWGDAAEAAKWRHTAVCLRTAVMDRLVLKQDHRCPSGFVLPKSTWAYGLRPDGSIEDRPLAGYFWAGADPVDLEGLIPEDRELLAVYDRTLAAALPLYEKGRNGVVSGYAVSYDGEEASLVLAALCDRTDALGPLVKWLARQTDADQDGGSEFAELSRWAYGRAGDAEDTNLVCAAGYLWGLRVLVGIDDVLTDGRQLRLVPRLPWNWTGLRVNDWPARVRDAQGRPRWTRLSFELKRDPTSARFRLRSADEVAGLQVRLGPFARQTNAVTVSIDGIKTAARVETSGDAAWAWVRFDSQARNMNIEALAAQR